MKTLLILILAFALQGGPGYDNLPGPYIKSKTVGLYESEAEESRDYPNMIVLQSARAVNGEYFLLLVVSSRDRQFGQGCPRHFIVDQKELTMPCFEGRSVEVIPGAIQRHKFGSYLTSHIVVRSKGMKAVLAAKSVGIAFGDYTFSLSDRALEHLRSVVVVPAKKPVGKSARF